MENYEDVQQRMRNAWHEGYEAHFDKGLLYEDNPYPDKGSPIDNLERDEWFSGWVAAQMEIESFEES